MAPVAAHHVSAAERQGILDLVHDLPAVWHAGTTTHAERKRVVRFLIQDVRWTKLANTLRVDGRWQPHAGSPLQVPRPQPASVSRRTAPEVVERMRQLALDHTDSEIAERLNNEGYRSGRGGAGRLRPVRAMGCAMPMGSRVAVRWVPRPVPQVSAGTVTLAPRQRPSNSTGRWRRLPIGARGARAMASKSRRAGRGGSRCPPRSSRPYASPGDSPSPDGPKKHWHPLKAVPLGSGLQHRHA
jgi:hypothetical protein